MQRKHGVWKSQKKVSFNIASEASYVYILSGQKLIKNAKNGPFWRVFWKPEACGQTVLPDRSVLIGQKLVVNAKIAKIQMRHFGWFSNIVDQPELQYNLKSNLCPSDKTLVGHINNWLILLLRGLFDQ